jgi:hypothetical protein
VFIVVAHLLAWIMFIITTQLDGADALQTKDDNVMLYVPSTGILNPHVFWKLNFHSVLYVTDVSNVSVAVDAIECCPS